jgi:hypothetical protein
MTPCTGGAPITTFNKVKSFSKTARNHRSKARPRPGSLGKTPQASTQQSPRGHTHTHTHDRRTRQCGHTAGRWADRARGAHACTPVADLPHATRIARVSGGPTGGLTHRDPQSRPSAQDFISHQPGEENRRNDEGGGGVGGRQTIQGRV